MPPVTDTHRIRALLELDRPWAAYALADLEPPHSQFASWFCAEGEQPALVLVYRGYTRPVLMCMGSADGIGQLLEEAESAFAVPTQVLAVAKPDVLEVLGRRYRIERLTPMLRMVLNADPQDKPAIDDVVALGMDDLAAAQALYADGKARREAPEFFVPATLNEGVYFGIYEGSQLVAVAGTHVVSKGARVAGLGNIYTRHDRRGRGLGTRVTYAVTRTLRSMGVTTVVLNVRQSNEAAIRVYERLGFANHCSYYDALAASDGK